MMWYWGFGLLITVIFWGLMIWTIAALWSWGRRRRPGRSGPWDDAALWRGGAGPRGGPDPRRDDDPQQILARRFAAGEINEDEYHQRLEALRSRQYAGTADRG